MSAPLVIEFDLECTPAHAFDVWTTRTAMWWPKAHTMTGERDLEIVFEPRPGGRIFERAPDGTEHTWGSVTGWEPPGMLAYRWHLGQDPATPTDVRITFVALADHRCHVLIHHDGWDRLGSDADSRRRQNRAGWDALVEPFARAAQPAEIP